MKEIIFYNESMPEIIEKGREILEKDKQLMITIPSSRSGSEIFYTGERTENGIYRPLHVWTDLADVLGASIEIFEYDDLTTSFLLTVLPTMYSTDREGYSPDGEWGRVNKIEDPFFVESLTESIGRVSQKKEDMRILALGMNDGRELFLLEKYLPQCYLLGIDKEPRAIDEAKKRWQYKTCWEWQIGDINHLPEEIGQFDLIWCLSVLQSPSIRIDTWLANMRKYHIHSETAFILGFPNAKYRAGVLSYGARMKNYARPDLSLITADLTDLRRRLQKMGYRVYMTGKYEIILTAVPI